jgi:uncharacterized protein
MQYFLKIDIRWKSIYIVHVEYIHFTWNSSKDSLNLSKHGVSFDEARTAFFDEKARIMNDPEHSDQEDRFLLLGMSRKLRLLLVCHCYKESEDQIRIISARKATTAESEQYWRS